MNSITAAEAFSVLAKWGQERSAIHVAMSRSVRQRAAGAAIINEVLPHSQKVLLTLRDENGGDIGVTVDLTAAEWETGSGRTCSPPRGNEGDTMLRDFADIRWVRFLAAAFPNGNRYVFGERAAAVSE